MHHYVLKGIETRCNCGNNSYCVTVKCTVKSPKMGRDDLQVDHYTILFYFVCTSLLNVLSRFLRLMILICQLCRGVCICICECLSRAEILISKLFTWRSRLIDHNVSHFRHTTQNHGTNTNIDCPESKAVNALQREV